MRRRATGVTVPVALVGAALAACGGGTDRGAPLADELSRDLRLASEATASVPAAGFGDTAAMAEPVQAPSEVVQPEVARPAPVAAQRVPEAAPAPTPAPEAPTETPAAATTADLAPASAPAAAARVLLAAGTTLSGATGTRVCTTTNRPGDRLVMRLAAPVTGADGTVLAAGTAVLLEVAAVDSTVVLRARSLQHDGELHPLVATASAETALEESRVASGSDKGKVIGGAIAGAILGQVLGKDTRATVIGAAGGAAAGTIAARRSGSRERCLPAGATVRVVLDQPLTTIGPA